MAENSNIEWRPIETAPKDGTVIDVLLWGTSRMPNVQWGMTDGMAVDIETWIDTFSAMPVWGPSESPEIVTHWLPIPPAPHAFPDGEGV
ncbi:hypothetical protein [Cohaesibacter gelatinilyticus]|uniref:DUF551 domain-containing protein n=1 Tax=Cohaesibacter gelatinilyticus TaxID=372072 RepID=A0A285PNH0_9HYPH|nr:hypothetical protein [Cohaesibacter gelatinilyticus]SNZ21676.1 hypothetical protein SAMN06265368_4801 [Cohaesibacter gelatinilyticus]